MVTLAGDLAAYRQVAAAPAGPRHRRPGPGTANAATQCPAVGPTRSPNTKRTAQVAKSARPAPASEPVRALAAGRGPRRPGARRLADPAGTLRAARPHPRQGRVLRHRPPDASLRRGSARCPAARRPGPRWPWPWPRRNNWPDCPPRRPRLESIMLDEGFGTWTPPHWTQSRRRWRTWPPRRPDGRRGHPRGRAGRTHPGPVRTRQGRPRNSHDRAPVQTESVWFDALGHTRLRSFAQSKPDEDEGDDGRQSRHSRKPRHNHSSSGTVQAGVRAYIDAPGPELRVRDGDVRRRANRARRKADVRLDIETLADNWQPLSPPPRPARTQFGAVRRRGTADRLEPLGGGGRRHHPARHRRVVRRRRGPLCDLRARRRPRWSRVSSNEVCSPSSAEAKGLSCGSLGTRYGGWPPPKPRNSQTAAGAPATRGGGLPPGAGGVDRRRSAGARRAAADRGDLPRALGYIKTHHQQYLPPEQTAVVRKPRAGQRTPVFLIGRRWQNYTWYLRLPGPAGSSWAGVVRLEASADLSRTSVIELANPVHHQPALGSACPPRTRMPGRRRTSPRSPAWRSGCARCSATNGCCCGHLPARL